MERQAVILAGGLGTRLRALTGGLPKALVPIAGKPLIIHQLELLARHDFTQVLLLLRHGAETIVEACGNGDRYGLQIDHVIEEEPRGTAGALLMARDRLQETFAVLYGDTVLNVDLARMLRAHRAARADLTLFVHPNDHPEDSDLVEVDAAQKVVAFHSKPHLAGSEYANIVSAALYMVEARCFAAITPPPGIFDFGAHLLPELVAAGRHIHAYHSREYIKDAGTPERLMAVVADVQSGRVASGSLETPAPAICLDRDGTLNPDPGHISNPDRLRLFPGTGEAIRRINRSHYIAAVVTNQPVVARGDVDEAGLQRIHNRLEKLLGDHGAYLDAIYYCPHHPDRGFPGERPELKIDCACRKPKPGLIERAAAEMNIDRGASWMIGDSFVDVELAYRAGRLSALVATGNGGQDRRFARRPDFEFCALPEAVDFILDAWPDLARRADEVAADLEPGQLVLIGGQARSGKSSFASALKWQLMRRGFGVQVISLDGWLKPLETRATSGTVLDRFDLTEMDKVLISCLAKETTAITVPLYNRKLRRPDGGYRVDVSASDIVIIEGVIALLQPFASDRETKRIFVSRDEAQRYQAMQIDYRMRGLSDTELAVIYAERQKDEVPLIAKSQNCADVVVDTP